MTFHLTLQSASGSRRVWRGSAANEGHAVRKAARELTALEPSLTGWLPLYIDRSA